MAKILLDSCHNQPSGGNKSTQGYSQSEGQANFSHQLMRRSINHLGGDVALSIIEVLSNIISNVCLNYFWQPALWTAWFKRQHT